jgi:hypothetical protein
MQVTIQRSNSSDFDHIPEPAVVCIPRACAGNLTISDNRSSHPNHPLSLSIVHNSPASIRYTLQITCEQPPRTALIPSATT